MFTTRLLSETFWERCYDMMSTRLKRVDLFCPSRPPVSPHKGAHCTSSNKIFTHNSYQIWSNFPAQKRILEHHLMPGESFDRPTLSNFTNINHVIGGAGSEGIVVSPINIKSWSWKKIIYKWLDKKDKPNCVIVEKLSKTEHGKAPEWNSNCCFHSPDFTSHTIAVLSTLPLRR